MSKEQDKRVLIKEKDMTLNCNPIDILKRITDMLKVFKRVLKR